MRTVGPTARTQVAHPEWFAAFLADRGTRKPSTHTMKAYRQDFDTIAGLIVGSDEGPFSNVVERHHN